MARRLNFKQRLYLGGEPVDSYTDLATYISVEVTDDVGLLETTIVVPALSAYTAYTLNLNSSALFTYFVDVSNSITTGAEMKINALTTEFSIKPDLFLEETISSVLIKNDSSNKRVIRVFQAVPRILTTA